MIIFFGEHRFSSGSRTMIVAQALVYQNREKRGGENADKCLRLNR